MAEGGRDDAAETAADTVPTAGLADAIDQLHALAVGVVARLLTVVRAYDESEAWREDGAVSMATWLIYRLGVSASTAREWVRMAHALADLPAIAAALGEGRLSLDQLAPLTRLAVPETDAELAEAAPGWSAAHLESLARHRRAPAAQDAAEAHRRRRLTFHQSTHSLRIRGELPTEAGAAVKAALDRLAEDAPPDPETGIFDPYPSRMADALVALAATELADESDGHRTTVVVHADPAALAGLEDGLAELPDGTRLANETLRRLACDGRVQLVTENERGEAIQLGRMTRRAPIWMTRALRRRDRGCRFPGCSRTGWLHAHHAVHWADGGTTDPSNLVLLCSHHHVFVHEHRWRTSIEDDGTLVLTRPDGRRLTSRPPPLRPDVRRRFLDAARAA